MKKLLTLGLIFPFLAFGQMTPSLKVEPTADYASVKRSDGYVSFGLGPLPIWLPAFGVGGRFQDGHHGCDISGQVSTVVAVTAVKENVSYLYFFKPSLASQFYVGGGASVTEVFGRHSSTQVLASPEFTFGKEYTNEAGDRRFFQLQVDFPLIQINHHGRTTAFPAALLSYGLCF